MEDRTSQLKGDWIEGPCIPLPKCFADIKVVYQSTMDKDGNVTSSRTYKQFDGQWRKTEDSSEDK